MNKVLIFVVFSLFVEANVTCKQFNSWEEAQSYYEAKKPGYKNLDKNHDGEACQNISHRSKKVEKYNLKTYIDGVPENLSKTYNSLSSCKKGIDEIKSVVKNKHYTYECTKK